MLRRRTESDVDVDVVDGLERNECPSLNWTSRNPKVAMTLGTVSVHSVCFKVTSRFGAWGVGYGSSIMYVIACPLLQPLARSEFLLLTCL